VERAWLRARVWGCDKHLENTELRVTRMHAHLSGAKHFPLPRPLDNPGVPGQKYTQTVRLPIFMCSNVHNGYRERPHAVELSALILFSKSRVLGRRFDIGILALTFSCRYCKFRISTIQCSLCTLSLPDVSLSRGVPRTILVHRARQHKSTLASCHVQWFVGLCLGLCVVSTSPATATVSTQTTTCKSAATTRPVRWTDWCFVAKRKFAQRRMQNHKNGGCIMI
jgi:hypothetical protein